MVEIFSPSYLRAGKTPLTKWLPEARLCVHEFEADDYQKHHARVDVIPDALKGNIARVRNWILEKAKAERIEEFAIMDDDIRAVRRWATHNKAPKFTPEKFREFIENGFNLAREWGCALWGVNADTGKGAFRENTPFSLSNYISGSFHGMISPETRYDEKLPLKEDYDFCLQELNRTRRILRINRAHLVKSDHKTTGGCAAYRTTGLETEQLSALEKKWGTDIVRRDSGAARTHRKANGVMQDINPIIRAPIGGV